MSNAQLFFEFIKVGFLDARAAGLNVLRAPFAWLSAFSGAPAHPHTLPRCGHARIMQAQEVGEFNGSFEDYFQRHAAQPETLLLEAEAELRPEEEVGGASSAVFWWQALKTTDVGCDASAAQAFLTASQIEGRPGALHCPQGMRGWATSRLAAALQMHVWLP